MQIETCVVCIPSEYSKLLLKMHFIINLRCVILNALKLINHKRAEFVSLKEGCTGSSESTLVKMPHCWKSLVAAQLYTVQ